MCSHHYLNRVAVFQELDEIFDIRARRVSYYQPCRQVDHFGTVLDHLISGVLNIPAGTPIAGGIPYQLKFFISVIAERALFLAHSPQAFSARAASVAVTYDDANSGLFFHLTSPGWKFPYLCKVLCTNELKILYTGNWKISARCWLEVGCPTSDPGENE